MILSPIHFWWFLMNLVVNFVRQHCIDRLKDQVYCACFSKKVWLNNYYTQYLLFWYMIFIIVIISLLSHSRTGVVVLSTDSSGLIPLRGHIFLDITRIISLCLIRRWILVYLVVSLWNFSRGFSLVSDAELDFLWG